MFQQQDDQFCRATTWPYFHILLLQYYYICCGYSMMILRYKYFRNFGQSLRLNYIVALSRSQTIVACPALQFCTNFCLVRSESGSRRQIYFDPWIRIHDLFNPLVPDHTLKYGFSKKSCWYLLGHNTTISYSIFETAATPQKPRASFWKILALYCTN